VPLTAVGKITSKLVPKATIIAGVAGTPAAKITQYMAGTMTKPPPIPSSPLAKPAAEPVANNIAV